MMTLIVGSWYTYVTHLILFTPLSPPLPHYPLVKTQKYTSKTTVESGKNISRSVFKGRGTISRSINGNMCFTVTF